MTHVSDYQSAVQRVVGAFRNMPEHQRLVYAVETVVEQVAPSAMLGVTEAQAFVDSICDEREVDAPEIVVKRVRGFEACASHEHNAIVLSGTNASRLLLCHELAHLLVPKGEGHNETWRTTFVALARRHVSVEHGSLLHTLYNRCGLACQW